MELIRVATLVFVLSACSDNDALDTGQPPTSPNEQEVILTTGFALGENGVGSWDILETSDFSLDHNLFFSKGAPYSYPDFIEHVGTGVGNTGGPKTGFTYNKVDGKFYGVLSQANDDLWINQGGSNKTQAALIKFDPTTDDIELVTYIPKIQLTNASKSLSGYNLSPVISENGRDLILVATEGGVEQILSPDRNTGEMTGGIVHIDIDPNSSGYKTSTPVYGFHEYSLGKQYTDRILKVVSKPLLSNTPLGDILLLISEEERYSSSGSEYETGSKIVFFKPSDSNDWSQPWGIEGNVTSVVTSVSGIIGRQPYYDNVNNEYWIIYDSLAGTHGNIDESFLIKFSGPGGNWESSTHTIFDATEGLYLPQALLKPKSGGIHSINAGISSSNTLLSTPKITQLFLHKDENIEQNFSKYSDPTKGRSILAHVTNTPSIGTFFVNATSSTSAVDFESYLTFLKESSLPSDDVFNQSLQKLYDDYNIPSSYVDAYQTSNYAREDLIEGNAQIGQFFTGAPAVGSQISEPINSRYVVQYALGGGDNGLGALIKYDRLLNSTTSVPLGASTISNPVGQTLQESNGTLIGGIYDMPQSGLTPLETSHGIWIKKQGSEALTGISLPSVTTESSYGQDVYAEANLPPIKMFETSNGGTWGVAEYFKHELAISPTYDRAQNALIKIDSVTESIEGPYFFNNDLVTFYSTNSPIEGYGNTLMYFDGALSSVDANTAGQRLHVIDVSTIDSSGKPAWDNVLWSPSTGFGVANNYWYADYAPKYNPTDGNWYALTTKNGSSEELALHRIELSNNDVSTLQVTTLATSTSVVSNTSLLLASDGMLYFGSTDGKLMRFSPSGSSFDEVYDFTQQAGTTEIRGFLSETEDNEILAVAVDSDSSMLESHVRALTYVIQSNTGSSEDISDFISVNDPYPGLNIIKN
jgi:hypothetical protein